MFGTCIQIWQQLPQSLPSPPSGLQSIYALICETKACTLRDDEASREKRIKKSTARNNDRRRQLPPVATKRVVTSASTPPLILYNTTKAHSLCGMPLPSLHSSGVDDSIRTNLVCSPLGLGVANENTTCDTCITARDVRTLVLEHLENSRDRDDFDVLDD